MAIFLFLLSVISFLFGIGVFASGASAIHQILGAVFWLICAVLLVGASIVEAVNRGSKKLIEATQQK